MYTYTADEKFLIALISVTTNFSVLPLAISCMRRGMVYESVIGACSAATSIMYHVGEIYETNYYYTLFGLRSSQWHRLDNVFTIACFSALCFYFMENKNPKVDEFFRWSFLAFTLYCQERAPWEIFFTILPISVALCIMIGKFLLTRTRPHWLFTRSFAIGISIVLFAAYFFVRGLDDHNDYLRIHHGLWHFFGGFGFYFLFHSRDRKEKEGYQMASIVIGLM